MPMFNLKKHRTFDLGARLGHEQEKEKRIKFDRLPRKKVRSIWYYLFIFILSFVMYYYLTRY